MHIIGQNILIIPFLIVAVICTSCTHTRQRAIAQIDSRDPDTCLVPISEPLLQMESIYSCKHPEKLYSIIKNDINFLTRNKSLFFKILEDVASKNDNVNLKDLEERVYALTEKDKIRLAIRRVNRIIFRLGEIDKSAVRLTTIFNILSPLDDEDWRIGMYFLRPLYAALAAVSPSDLELLLRQKMDIPRIEEAVLALIRVGYFKRDNIKPFLSKIEPETALLYIDDPFLKLNYLNDRLSKLQSLKYLQRIWRGEREIINAFASFPEGRSRLQELKKTGVLDFVEMDGIFFGTLAGSAIDLKTLTEHEKTLQKVSEYLKLANERFSGPEKVFYVDITPDMHDGKRLNGAGWGTNSIFLTLSTIKETSRAVSFTLLHEACERKLVQGVFSSELGLTYIAAFRNDNLLEKFRLGRRIGGDYINSGYGHPWDSEREWLAEVASAVIIGEDLGIEAQPALHAVEQLFKRNNP